MRMNGQALMIEGSAPLQVARCTGFSQSRALGPGRKDLERVRGGPVTACHRVFAGKPWWTTDNREFRLARVDAMLRRHDEISHEWQGAHI
jgi:hypothetical protein